MPLDPDKFVVKKSSTNALMENSSTNAEMETVFSPMSSTSQGAPTIVTFQDVSAASFRIVNAIQRTPCILSHLSEMFNMNLYFKMEQMQYTGSVVERGALYALTMLSPEQKAKGVVAGSSGNFGIALASLGKEMGIPVTLVMPPSVPMMKVKNCEENGARIIFEGADIGESLLYASQLAADWGVAYINGFDNPHVIAGLGTMALEIVEQVPDIEAIIIPTGGGGLVAGTAVALKTLKPDVKIYAVETTVCPSFSISMKKGVPVHIDPQSSTLADSIAVCRVGRNALATAVPLVDKIIAVEEESIATAILRLIEVEKVVIEGGGAVGLAAIVQGLVPELLGKNVVVALGGGNIDTAVLGRSLERGLAADNRLCRFVVRVSDRPGGIAELASLVAELGVSIKGMFHERAWIRSDIFAVAIKCVVETRDADHAMELQDKLLQIYGSIVWGVRRIKFGDKLVSTVDFNSNREGKKED